MPAAPPAGRKRFPKLLIVVLVVVVVVVIVLAALWAAGVGPFAPASSSKPSGGGGGGGGSGITFSKAAGIAQPATSSVVGGPWTLIGGVGVQISTSVAVNTTVLNSTSSIGGCRVHLLLSASSMTTIPSSSSSPSSGATNAWVIWFANSTIGILEVAVFGGTATPILTEGTYGSCSLDTSAVSLPSDYIDSPAAATVAYSAGGNAFVAAHSPYDLDSILVPSVSLTVSGKTTTTAATWEISYTDCNEGADDGTTLGGQSPAQFTASVNATSGALIQTFNTTSACPSSHSTGGGGGGGAKPPLSDCYFPFSQENTTTTYWNNGTLICSVSTLTAGDLTIGLKNNTTGATVPTTGFTLEIMNATTLAIVSTYNFATNIWSSPSVPVGSVYSYDVWVLITPTTMAGNNIVATATASAPVTGSVSSALGGP